MTLTIDIAAIMITILLILLIAAIVFAVVLAVFGLDTAVFMKAQSVGVPLIKKWLRLPDTNDKKRSKNGKS